MSRALGTNLHPGLVSWMSSPPIPHSRHALARLYFRMLSYQVGSFWPSKRMQHIALTRPAEGPGILPGGEATAPLMFSFDCQPRMLGCLGTNTIIKPLSRCSRVQWVRACAPICRISVTGTGRYTTAQYVHVPHIMTYGHSGPISSCACSSSNRG